jgi:uncharacterized phiE125 gp8 family phage protein
MLEYPQGAWNRHQTSPLPCTVELERLSVGALLLDDFKVHLRVSGTAEDSLLARFLNVAARSLEDDTRRLLLTGTVKEYFDVWPWDYLVTVQLTRAPVVSVTSVTYYDTANVLQTWSSSDYMADTLSEPARIVMAEVPTLVSPNIDQRPNCVAIEYECGYGSSVTNLPAESINAIMVKAAYLYARGRELGTAADADAVERCWQNEIRRLTWSAL